MASTERTAYPRFKRFMSVRELHAFYTPQPDEIVWAGEAAGSDEHLLALVTQTPRALAGTLISRVNG